MCLPLGLASASQMVGITTLIIIISAMVARAQRARLPSANSRVEHGGQHELFIGGEARPAKTDGHGIVGRVAKVLQHLLPFSSVFPIHINAIDGKHSMSN